MGSRILDFADGFSSSTSPTTQGDTSVSSGIESISASGNITLGTSGDQLLRVTGNAGAVTTATTPFGTTPPSTGTIVRVMGTDDTNTVTIPFNDAADGCYMNGDATLGKYNVITFVYEANADRYIEISRNF